MAAVPSTGRASEVERAAAREADATRALYERYAGQIYGFCLHRLGSREEAEDAVQTTFLNAFRGLQRGVVPEAESAWLFKIAENVCLTRHRSAWRRGRVESPSDMQALQDVTPARERDGDELIPLGDALSAMPEAQRRAILLREWQGLSYKEIAVELDVSQSAVETLIFRARRSLANALETPWRERRAAGQAGRRAFDVTSLLAGLKALFAGGTAAKVAIVAVAATGTAALAVAESRHPAPAERVEPSRSAARAPDSVRSLPVVALPAPSSTAGSAGGAAAPTAENRDGTRGAARASRGSGSALEKARKVSPAAPETSRRPEMPPGQAKERGTSAKSARPERPQAKAKPKVKPKPAGTSKPKPKPAEPKADKPKPQPPKAEQPAPTPPAASGPPRNNPKEKDEPK